MSLTILAPAVSVELAALADAQAELGLSPDPVQDVRLARLVRVASVMVASYCGRPFGLATYMQDDLGYSSRYGGLAILEARPVVALQSITEAGVTQDVTQFKVDPATGILRRAEWFGVLGDLPGEWDGWHGWAERWWCHGGATATFQAGYTLPGNDVVAGVDPLPDDITQATVETVKALWFNSGTSARDPRIRSEMVQGVGSTSFLDPTPQTGALPMLAAEMLSTYRDPGF